MTTPTRNPVAAAPAEQLDLHTLIDTTLRQLDNLITQAAPLVDTHQRGIGFLTVEAAKVMDDNLRAEKRDRINQAKWGIKLTGPVPAPVTVSAVSLIDEAERVCGDWASNLEGRLERAGICFLYSQSFTGIGYDDAQTARLAAVVEVIRTPTTLGNIHRDLEALVVKFKTLIDGSAKAYRLREPCPYCHLHTLVCYPEQHLVVCEQDPKTGRYEPCVCDDSYCHCKTRAHRRHEWTRTNRGKWGLYGLRDALNLANRTTNS